VSDVIIKVEDVVKVYKVKDGGVTALRGVSFEVYRGEFLIIMGPSGSGKTTLLNLIGGLDTPSSGRIYVDKRQIDRMSEWELNEYRLRKVGIVFQFLNLIARLTARENIELPMIAAGIPPKERDERISYLLNKLGIGDKADRLVEELSGGEQQRVALAAALANDPPIILADEPTAELDKDNIERVIRFMRELSSKGKTIIVNTHDPRVSIMSDRVILLEDGMIKGIYTPTEVQRESKKEFMSIADYFRKRIDEINEEIRELLDIFREGKMEVENFIKKYNELKTIKEVYMKELRIAH